MLIRVKSIKKTLSDVYKFNGDKLELAICGFSIGSYLAILYGYSMKNHSPIPIKFIIDISGFLYIDPNYFYAV